MFGSMLLIVNVAKIVFSSYVATSEPVVFGITITVFASKIFALFKISS